jgi:hypothetical protein
VEAVVRLLVNSGGLAAAIGGLGRGVPHSGQKRSSGVNFWPQFVQKTAPLRPAGISTGGTPLPNPAFSN